MKKSMKRLKRLRPNIKNDQSDDEALQEDANIANKNNSIHNLISKEYNEELETSNLNSLGNKENNSDEANLADDSGNRK